MGTGETMKDETIIKLLQGKIRSLNDRLLMAEAEISNIRSGNKKWLKLIDNLQAQIDELAVLRWETNDSFNYIPIGDLDD